MPMSMAAGLALVPVPAAGSDDGAHAVRVRPAVSSTAVRSFFVDNT